MNFLSAHLHLVVFAALVVLAAIVAYRPPKILSRFGWLGTFIDGHFGDSIAIFLLLLGISLSILSGFYPQLSATKDIGGSLVLTAMAVLKLNGKPNGSSPASSPTPVSPASSDQPKQ
jgi:hypothetical protein